MRKTTLIKNVNVVFGEKKTARHDILVVDGVITRIAPPKSLKQNPHTSLVINGTNLHLFPGLIDDQVHFREPGLTHKAEIHTESRAAVAGGVTSFMEMPNTVPNTVTIELLEDKYTRASQCSLANYSFFMGGTNTNLEELLNVDPRMVCGVKLFLGSSTGNMLVDDLEALEEIFKQVKMLIAVHCENDVLIKENLGELIEVLGEENIVAAHHPIIRSREACYASSSYAVALAKKHGTRLHVLHISTKEELDLFTNTIPLAEKMITAEACIHHLVFSSDDYLTKGNLIKWNPAVKSESDRVAILKAVLAEIIDIIASDHAPHTLAEKLETYLKAPSGGPLVQHSLNAMLEKYHNKDITLQQIAKKMCNNPAELFRIEKRGFIREGYKADLVLVDLNKSYTVSKKNIHYKCKWSPFEGTTFHSKVTHTFVNGNLVYKKGTFFEIALGERLMFDRQ